MKIPAAIAIALLSHAASAQQSSQVPWWSGTWDAAFAEAKTRNVPVLVVFIQDGEEANERLASGTLKDPEYVKATQKTVPVLANREFHGSKKDDVAGTTKVVCVKFGATSCEAHQNLETPARVELCGNEVQTPLHVLCLPDKTIVHKIVDVAPISAYQELIAKGTKTLGRGLTAVELRQLRDQLRDAGVKLEKEEWAAALKVAREAQATAKDTPFAKEVDAVLAKVDGEAKKHLERATTAEKQGETLTALRILDSAVEDFAGTESVVALKKELTRVRSTKAGTEAARILAKEKKALTNFDAGLAAEKAKDFISARREYQRVITAAGGTPLGDRAKARLEALAADPDIKTLFDRADLDAKAAAALKDAEKLRASGMKDAARDAFKRIVDEFPGTSAAATAKTRLEELR